MKIFLSLKVPRGDAELETITTHLKDVTCAAGHILFVAPEEITSAGITEAKDFMPFVRENLEDTDLFIVIYHPDLRGGLIEVGIAYECRIPIWLCHKEDEKISSSMLGCANVVLEYKGLKDLKEKVQQRLINATSVKN